MNILKDLQPESVFHYFETISQIPRGSGNEAAIRQYIMDFASKRSLWATTDAFNNVLVKKEGTKGFEHSAPVILQGHLDMVCEKNERTVHDFLSDPIFLETDGQFVWAKDTTLGADNGIAVAYALALLDAQTIPHPPIEALFTANEEAGMEGAIGFDYGQLQGKVLINMDSGEEGKVWVSCAGGLRLAIRLPIKTIHVQTQNTTLHQIRIRGLKGGHSGTDIVLQRANANVLAGRVLDLLEEKVAYDLVSIFGGAKDNAIPREADITIVTDSEDNSALKEALLSIESIFRQEYRGIEETVHVALHSGQMEKDATVFTKESKTTLIQGLTALLDGVHAMSKEIPGLVETSSNLGIITTETDAVTIAISVRSTEDSRKQFMAHKFIATAKLMGAECIVSNDYPGWAYDPDSALRKTLQSVYAQMNEGQEMIPEAIHAGLECGLFSKKLPGVDMVSIGPNMWDIHTPDERVEVGSVRRVWEFLLTVLKELK